MITVIILKLRVRFVTQGFSPDIKPPSLKICTLPANLAGRGSSKRFELRQKWSPAPMSIGARSRPLKDGRTVNSVLSLAETGSVRAKLCLPACPLGQAGGSLGTSAMKEYNRQVRSRGDPSGQRMRKGRKGK